MEDNKVASVILLVLVILLLFVVNIFAVRDKINRNVKTTTKVITTTKKKEDLLSDEKMDKIIIEGLEEDIVVKNYRTHLGYNFNYETALFNPVLLSNSSIELNYILDSTMYIKFERLTDEVYYDEYEKNNSKEVDIDGYLESYSFYRYKNIFLKVTKRIKNTPEYLESLNVRMQYTLNSISFN